MMSNIFLSLSQSTLHLDLILRATKKQYQACEDRMYFVIPINFYNLIALKNIFFEEYNIRL